jgi:hypothetical protein
MCVKVRNQRLQVFTGVIPGIFAEILLNAAISVRIMADKIEGVKMKYRVKLIFKYSDVVHVDAKDEKEAVSLALDECEEMYESFYDAEVTEEK